MHLQNRGVPIQEAYLYPSVLLYNRIENYYKLEKVIIKVKSKKAEKREIEKYTNRELLDSKNTKVGNKIISN